MTRRLEGRAGYWATVVVSALVVATVFGVYWSSHGGCEAVLNRAHERSARYVPWVLFAAEVVGVAAASKLWRRRASTIAIAIILASSLIVAAGIAGLAWRFLSDGCYK